MSLLAVPGSLLWNRTTGLSKAYFVLLSSEHAALVLEVLCKKIDGKPYVSIKEPMSWKQISITEPEEWFAQDLDVMPPALTASCWPSLPGGWRIGLMPLEDSPYSVLKFCAKMGLSTMTTPMMNRLYKFLEVPHLGRMPTTEHSLAQALISFIFPKASDEEVKAMVKKRYEKKQMPYETTLEADEVEHVAEEFDLDEEAVQKVFHELTQAKAAKTSKGSAASSSGGGGKSSAKPVKKHIDIDEVLTQEAAKKLIPDVKNCRITKDTTLHMRWAATYPRPVPPTTVTKALGTSSDKAALLFVLKQLWVWHMEATGEACPFELC